MSLSKVELEIPKFMIFDNNSLASSILSFNWDDVTEPEWFVTLHLRFCIASLVSVILVFLKLKEDLLIVSLIFIILGWLE